MNKLAGIFALLITASFSFSAFTPKEDKINWLSMEEALALNEKKPRKFLIDVYTNWCGPCKRMNSTTFVHPFIVEYVNKNYYAVKFNAEGNDTIQFKGKVYVNKQFNPEKVNTRNGTHEFTMAIAPVNGRVAYPTIVYFDEDLNYLTGVQGAYGAKDLEPVLKWFGSDAYIENPDFNSFKANFVPEVAE